MVAWSSGRDTFYTTGMLIAGRALKIFVIGEGQWLGGIVHGSAWGCKYLSAVR